MTTVRKDDSHHMDHFISLGAQLTFVLSLPYKFVLYS